MRHKPLLITCLQTVLLLLTLCALTSPLPITYAATLNVPQDYLTIQQAIDAASAGDTIQVGRRSGEAQSVYSERLLINKQLALIGEGREFVIIDGGGAGTVVRIQADDVEVRGFTIRNAGTRYTGVRVNGYSYVTLTDNAIKTNKHGISLLDSDYNNVTQNILFSNSATGISLSDSLDNTIQQNHVSDSAYGIQLYSTNVTFILNNTVDHTSYGIYLEHTTNNTIDGNTLQMNRVDGIFPYASYDLLISHNAVSDSAYGIQLHSTHTATVLDNRAENNSYSVYLAYAGPSNTIENNTLSNSDWAIRLYSSSSNTIIGNTLSYNTYGVDPSTESNNNQLYHNNFVENTEQAVWNPDCVNTWDNGYPSGGNYWSDYTGTDSNGDGIGDTPYTIDPLNRDRYPLMSPYGPHSDVAVTDVTLSDSLAYQGELVEITVTAENHGTQSETFNVTVEYENTTLAISGTVDTQEVVDLAPDAAQILVFQWNTTDQQPCTIYTIKAEASAIPGEFITTNNLYIDGTVKVKLQGDVNGDGTVDILDLSLMGQAYGRFAGDPKYNPEADINQDGLVDIRDVALVSKNYGKTC